MLDQHREKLFYQELFIDDVINVSRSLVARMNETVGLYHNLRLPIS